MIKFNANPILTQLDALIAKKISSLPNEQKDNRLLIVQIGDNADSARYVALKKSYCESLGIKIEVLKLDVTLGDTLITNKVSTVLNDSFVGGSIIQLPLPNLALNPLLNLIPKNKDIDLISQESLNSFYNGDFSRVSPVVRSASLFLAANLIPNFEFTQLSNLIVQLSAVLRKKKIIILGEGFLVGKPLAFFYKSLGADVQVINDYKLGYKLDADFIILATDTYNLVQGDDVVPNASIIDFGSSIINGKTIGNLNKDSSLDHLGVISFSPGGMGPLVIRGLICNYLCI